MIDQKVFRHVRAVRAAAGGGFVGTVVGAPDEQAVVIAPIFVNPCTELLEGGDVAIESADCFYAF